MHGVILVAWTDALCIQNYYLYYKYYYHLRAWVKQVGWVYMWGSWRERGELIQKENLSAGHLHTHRTSLIYIRISLPLCRLFHTLHAQSGRDVWYWQFLICITRCVSAPVLVSIVRVCWIKKRRSNINKKKKKLFTSHSIYSTEDGAFTVHFHFLWIGPFSSWKNGNAWARLRWGGDALKRTFFLLKKK